MAHNPPAPTNGNIVLTKLRPGQEIDMELHAIKGLGKDHAKFSPVGTFTLISRCLCICPSRRGISSFRSSYLMVVLYVATASYRLLPKIILNPEKPVPAHLAAKFKTCFADGVIKINPRTKEVSVDENHARRETMSREVYRHHEFEECVQLARVRDHFLCKFPPPLHCVVILNILI